MIPSPTGAAPAQTSRTARRTIDIAATLGWYRHGAGDPTTWLSSTGSGTSSSGRFVRATHTPDGPGTIEITWTADELAWQGYGPGAAWLIAQAPLMMGDGDSGHHLDTVLNTAADAVVARAATADQHLRWGASGDLYHELLPVILAQRITVGEAHDQWHRLCFELGDTAPGPHTRLLLPPRPEVLMRQPSWWFHPLGIERARAEPLIKVGWHAAKFWGWAAAGAAEVASKLSLIPGIGQWTIGSVLGPALGDPDAVPVGDFHFKNIVGFNLANEARATDERMMELLEPYVGQRGRVVRVLARHGNAPPKFGPKKRILPMRNW